MRGAAAAAEKRKDVLMVGRRWISFLSFLLLSQCGVEGQTGGPQTVVETEEELQAALLLASPVARILLDADEILLTEPLVIASAGTRLEGRSDGSTILRCSEALSSQSALLILAGDVQIRSLGITQCREQSAVFLEPVPGDRLLTMDVSFENVTFSNNGRRRRSMFGGALRVGSCAGLSCLRPFLSLRSCSFLQNQAMYGGAIYLTDSDLIISDSTFRENRADLSGGAIYSTAKHTTATLIEASLFEDNRAMSDSEVHGMEEPDLLITPNQTLANVGMGGAIFADHLSDLSFDLCTFVHNIACRGGGGITVMSGELLSSPNITFAFSLRDSLFRRNEAYCGDQRDALQFSLVTRNAHQGGGIHYEYLDNVDTQWTMANTSFLGNHARTAGAVLLLAPALSATEHPITSCTFRGNAGLVSAGAVAGMSTHVVLMSTTLKDNRAVYGGGFLSWRNGFFETRMDPDRPDVPNVIEGSSAIYGGGIYSDTGGTMLLASLILRNNTAFRYGGGLRVFNVAAIVTLRGVLLEGNSALTGGGIAILALTGITITSDNGRPTICRNNQAVVGGGFYYEPGHYIALIVRVENAEFIGNRALPIASPEMSALLEEDIEFQALPEANVQLPDIDEQLGNFTLFNFLTEVAEGHGGGIGITLVNIRLFTVVEVVFQNLLVTQNEAIVGGGISAHMTDLYWNRVNVTTCFPSALGLDTCQRFVFLNVTVTENRAEYAGGVFSSLPDGIQVSCSSANQPHGSETTLLQDNLDSAELDHSCNDIRNNSLFTDEDANGIDAGTGVVFLEAEGWDGPLKQVASEDFLALPCLDSSNASCSRDLVIAVKDVFNQTIVRGIRDANLTLVLISGDIVGDQRYTAVNGRAVISNTRAWGVNISSSVTIASDEYRDIQLVLHFSTRACHPGELQGENVCRKCPSEQYGFFPERGSCNGCENNARCPGGAALIPEAGFWHSSPFSPIMRPCIFEDACIYEGREENLTAFYLNATRLTNLLDALQSRVDADGPEPDFSDYEQCAEGYEGVLCGSCEDGYGHAYTGACMKCPEDGSENGLLLFLNMVWIFVLIGVNCGITLLSMNARVQLVKHELYSATANRTQGLTRAPHIDRQFRRSSRLPGLHRDRTSSSRELEWGDPQMQEILAEQLIATVQLTETLKILINYLQVTSAALQLDTDWNALLDGLLSAEGGLAGFSHEVLDVPFECNFGPGGAPASIDAIWMRLAVPWIILVGLLCVCSIAWFVIFIVKNSRSSQNITFNSHRFVTCLIVISVVSMYFSYIEVVRELLRAVNCVEVEDATEHGFLDHPYLNFALETGEQRVWAEDTALVCYEGSHLPVGIVGIIGLFISFCGIISILVWLPLNRKRVTKTEFVSRYWFLYQAYRKEWYTHAWEATILTRKSLVAAVVVFSVHLGPTLQAALCAGVLVMAQMMHSLFQPFKIPENHKNVPEYAGDIFRILRVPKLATHWIGFNNSVQLNSLESASLFASAAVFLAAIVLHDSNSSLTGRNAMVGFTFVCNAGFMLYMMYRLYAGLHVLLDLKLEMISSAYIATEGNSLGLISLVRKTRELLKMHARPLRHSDDAENPEDIIEASHESTEDGTDDENL